MKEKEILRKGADNMIKHFCDICKTEITQRVRVSIEAEEVYGEGYLRTIGETLMNYDYECCGECYKKLVDIVNAVGQVDIVDTVNQEESFSIFDKLRKLIKKGKDEQEG